MSRSLRLEFASALYHVTSRGDEREDIFIDDGDREFFLEVLAEAYGRFNMRHRLVRHGLQPWLKIFGDANE